MYALVDHPERQVEAIRRLNKSGVAGLVLCYVGTVLKDVSQELIDVCNELDFPLIVMFSLVGYKEIIRAVSDALLGLDNQISHISRCPEQQKGSGNLCCKHLWSFLDIFLKKLRVDF